MLNYVLSTAIYVAKNFIKEGDTQFNAKNEIFRLISEHLYGKFPDLKKNLFNYMMDIMNTQNSDHMSFFNYKLINEGDNEGIIKENNEHVNNPLSISDSNESTTIRSIDLSFCDYVYIYQIIFRKPNVECSK